ncbi:hypothetical protein D018_2985A, partial [Vibrio parahaemolyticus VP2007-007]
MPLAGPL